ncbi:MAG: hypothetical protein MI975_24890 [Cytophagales bacterium]|nr:hypothetical protein [Cytophagales bacterium]
MTLDDFKIYLPKYLSSESEKHLFDSLKDFPENIDQRLYTDYLKDDPVIYQGDGLNNLLAVNLPSLETKEVPGMIISNTCDIDPTNKRNFPSQIVYAPILSFKKYADTLNSAITISDEQIKSHLDAIRKQYITQIFYLPPLKNKLEESIVFLDRIFNIGNNYCNRNELNETRIFTLSDFGNYLFLFKLSLHFTRIQDKVERKSPEI